MIANRRFFVVLAAVAAGIAVGQSFARGLLSPQYRESRRVAIRQETLYGYKGVISGRVLLRDGSPAAGFLVRARFQRHQTGAPGEGTTVTDASGTYRITGLRPQGFSVGVENGGESFLTDTSQLVLLDQAPGKTAANIDFTLIPGPQVTVNIHNAQTGDPVSGINVYASSLGTGTREPIAITGTDGTARFRLQGWETQLRLEPNSRADSRQMQMAPGSCFYRTITFDGPDDVRDVTWDVKTYSSDPKLNEVVLKGTVTGLDGLPVSGAKVMVYRSWQPLQAVTDGAGEFRVKTTRMQPSEYGNWDGRKQKGIRIVATKGELSATHFATPDETWSSIPIQLQQNQWASVSGQLVGTDGKPLSGVPIHYMVTFSGGGYSEQNVPNSDAEGRFTIGHLQEDAYYQFRFGKPAHIGNDFGFGFTTVPSDNKQPFVCFDFTRLTLKKGEHRDLGKVVIPLSDTTLAGKLVTKSGSVPKGHLIVVIHGRHTNDSTYPDATGSFRFPHVVREPMTLFVFRSDDDGHSYSTDPKLPGVADRRLVHGGDESLKVVVVR